MSLSLFSLPTLLFSGGRHHPFTAHYRPQLFSRTVDVTCDLQWPAGTEDAANKMVMPGDNVEMLCDLVHDIPLEVGFRFTLRESGKTSKSSSCPYICVLNLCS